MSYAKHWCFTLNNYSDDDISRLAASFETGRVVYLIFGKEVAPSGTKHLQGFVSVKNKVRITGLVKMLGQAHFTVARSVPQSIEYCKKDGDITEFGSPNDVLSVVAQARKRNDLEDFKDAVKGGMFDPQILRENYSGIYARYPRFFLSYLRDHRPPIVLPDHTLRDWQQSLVDICNESPDPRIVYFVIDEEGNKGKTFICDYLECHFNAQVMKCGKRDDMAFQLDEFDPKVICIDVSRSAAQFLNYQFLEDIKDGRVFSPKYESTTKRFNTPHLLVFMNEYPDMTKLSVDRYEIKPI